MSGLTRKKIKVRSKSGKTYQRSVLVRAGEKVGRFVNKHKGKIAIAGAALVGAAVAGHFAHSRHIANVARAGAAHAHAQEAVRSAAKAATDHIRVNVDNIRKQHAKNREEMDAIERQMQEVRMRINARLHGEHYTGRQVDDQRQNQRDRSNHINEYAMRERRASAERSGHMSPGYGSGQKTARLRLGSGLPDPPPMRVAENKPKRKSRSSGRKRS